MLAYRKNAGVMNGKILMDGKAPDSSYRRVIGYVEQTGQSADHNFASY